MTPRPLARGRLADLTAIEPNGCVCVCYSVGLKGSQKRHLLGFRILTHTHIEIVGENTEKEHI